MRVFEDHEHGLATRQAFETPNESLQCPLLALLWAQFEYGKPLAPGKRQQVSNQPAVFCAHRCLREQDIELAELGQRIVVALEPGGALELADDRMERAIRAMRRAEVAQAEMRLAGNFFEKSGRQARLSDSWLARQQHDSAAAARCPPPAAAQQLDLFLTSDQRRLAQPERLVAAIDRVLT